MTKVLLIYANGFMDNLVPVGVSLLSSCLKNKDHEVKLFDTTFYRTEEGAIRNEARVKTLQVKKTDLSKYGVKEKDTDILEDFKKMVREFKPELIGFSVVEPTYPLALNLLRSIEDYDALKIMGGVHVTMNPFDVIKNPSLKMICVGEGEEAIVELANKIQNGEDYSNIRNLWVKKSDGSIIKNPLRPLVNLDELPMADWSIYEKERFFKPMGDEINISGAIELHRGCTHKCAFCCNEGLQLVHKGLGSYPRQKSIEKFIEEVKAKKRDYGLQYLYIVAENLLHMTPERFDKFIELYREVNLPFWAQARPETITEDKVARLAEIGCKLFSMGVEHGNEMFRRETLNRFVSNEKIIKAFEIIKQSKIKVCANIIIGFPDETRELVFDTIELSRQLQPDYLISNIFTPYRGTRLRDLAVKKGFISENLIAGDYRSDAMLDMPQLSKEEILGLQRTIPLYVKFPKSMWPEIKIAEKFDEKGNVEFEKLGKLYMG